MKKPTMKEYLSLSTNNDVPLKKRLTAKQLAVIKAILLGKTPSLTMVTGSRCAGRTSVLAIASLLHALHGDGNVLAVAGNLQYCQYTLRYGIQHWISVISPRPYEWEIQHYPELAFTSQKTGNTIYMASMNALRRMHDPYFYYTRLKGVRFIWFEDLENFETPMNVPGYFINRDMPCKFAINYQIQEWRDATQQVVSYLKPIITSSHSLMVLPNFTTPEIYRELRRVEAARRQMLKASNFYKKRNAILKKRLD